MVRVVVALVLAVLVGAVALPVTWHGIGWLIGALAAFGVAIVARSVRGQLVGPAPTPPAAPTAPASVLPVIPAPPTEKAAPTETAAPAQPAAPAGTVAASATA